MRIKRGVSKRKKHNKVLSQTKGFRLSYHKLYRRAKEAVLHAGQYSFNDRKKRANEFRKLWIKRINAALTPHEIKTIVSRAGEGTKIILTGDPDQIDNPYLDANSNGLSYTVERLKKHKIFGHILLAKSERSDLASLAVNEL